MDLEAWVQRFLHQPALARKRAVSPLLEVLDPRRAGRAFGLGDDCGYLSDGRGYLLLSTDSIREELLEHPRFAGFCAVNVAVNDIYATGGVPLALVDTMHLPEGDGEWAGAVARGLRDGCDFFELAMLGGHLDAGAARRGLSVTILGRASSLMGTFGAVPGDAVLFTYDPEGALARERCASGTPPAAARPSGCWRTTRCLRRSPRAGWPPPAATSVTPACRAPWPCWRPPPGWGRASHWTGYRGRTGSRRRNGCGPFPATDSSSP